MAEETKKPLSEVVKPFSDLIRAPRALWGVNLAYLLEGLAYFGVLGYLAIHFSDFVFQGVPNPNEHAHNMVAVLTAGITIAMLLLGFVSDRFGVRFALIASFVLMAAGRSLMAGAPNALGLEPAGLWSPLHSVTMAGIFLIVIGYGVYQPAAYAAVRKFTTPKTAGMAFAMLYALMNLGGWFPTFAFLLRDEKFAGLGISGTFWVFAGVTVMALLATVILLTPKTVRNAVETARVETERIKAEESKGQESVTPSQAVARRYPPVHMWVFAAAVVAVLYGNLSAPWNVRSSLGAAALWTLAVMFPRSRRFLADHPLSDSKFFFFIFALIPVQTLFTYNWLVLPQYISRAYSGWVGEYFEVASNTNPLLIFILTPIIAAMTQKRKVYDMMILGTFVMAAPAFFLTVGPTPWALGAYILIMTVGEAIWSPRFYQYAAEIAPEGRTGEYMGVAQLPWFLTKVIVPWFYSGRMMDSFCPAGVPASELRTETMWLFFALIAMISPVLLVTARGWIGKDFKTSA